MVESRKNADDHTPGELRKIAVKLAGRTRFFAGVFGAAALASGAVAVFQTTNEAGTVALILAGVVFALLAFTGVMPTRLKLGDGEVEWLAQVGRTLEQAVDNVPSAARGPLLQEIAELSNVAPEAANAPLRALMAQSAAIDSLQRALPPDATMETNVVVDGHEFDALITSPSGKRIVVDVKGSSRPLFGVPAEHTISRLHDAQKMLRADQGLLITTTAPAPGVIEDLATSGVAHVVVDKPGSDLSMQATLHRLLG